MEISEMDNSSTDTSPAGPEHPPEETLGNVILSYLPWVLTLVLNPPVCLLSLSTSVINVITFSKMDLSQGVNQNLLILSASDSVMAVLCMYGAILYLLLNVGYGGVARLRVILHLRFVLPLVNHPLNVSLLVTSVIAVVRCFSIVMPLSFRNIFTARRQLIIIGCCTIPVTAVLIYLNAMLIYKYLNTMPLILLFDPSPNMTVILMIEERDKLTRAFFDIFRNVLYYTCLSIIAVSMVFLIVALKRSSRFQRAASAAKPNSLNPTSSSSNKTSVTRETQVIKTVILVLAIFVACNLPLTLMSILRVALTEFSASGKYRLWHNFLNALLNCSVGLNVGLNFFAYYNCNSRFREIVRALFSFKRVADNKT